MTMRGIWLAVFALGCSSGESFSTVSALQTSGGAGGAIETEDAGADVAQPGCTQGDTRACLGPGACEGAQACGSDGIWGACECAAETGGTGGAQTVTGGTAGAAGAAIDPVEMGCDPGWLFCDGFCVDPRSDQDNCGACGTACADGAEVCEDRECVCAAGYRLCPPLFDQVGLQCVDVLTDQYNCSECSTMCTDGVCTDGVCVH